MHDEIKIFRINFTTTFIFQNDIKFKIENAKLINRNIKLQNEINTLKIKTLSTNFVSFIDKKNKHVKITNFFKFNENIFDFFYEI